MKAVWMGLVAFGLGSVPAVAEDQPWWVVMVNGSPSICGQSSEGQLLCLHPAGSAEATSPTVLPARFEAHDWSFLGGDGSAI